MSNCQLRHKYTGSCSRTKIPYRRFETWWVDRFAVSWIENMRTLGFATKMIVLALAVVTAQSSVALAQTGNIAPAAANNGLGTNWQTSGNPAGYSSYSGYSYTAPPRTRSNNEMSFLYATSIVYGVGLGVEFSAEVGIKDPGLFLIAPALLGVAAPLGAYALDKPT